MNQRINKVLVLAAIVIPAMSVAMWPASAQPGGADGNKQGQPGNRPPSGEGRGPRSEWAEKYRTELREHPRLARAIVALHEAKDYIQKPAEGAGDFGGNKDAALKACDDAIKKLSEAMKFDPKRQPGNSGGRDGDDKDDKDGKKDGKGGGQGRGNNDKK